MKLPKSHRDSWESKLEAATLNLDAARHEWIDTIVQARADGVPIRTVARHAGVSHQTVVNIINRQK